MKKKGYKFVGEDGVVKVVRGSLVYLKDTRQSANLYVLTGTTIMGDAHVASSSPPNVDQTKLWHMRLGHMSEAGMMELSKRKLLGSQAIEKLPFCEHCVFGKQKKVSFSSSTHTTKAILEYVHSDLWGPTRVPSHGGALYMLTIIDDY